MGSQLTAWALDLDGVIWRGTETVPGSPQAVARLRALQIPIAFVTNSALRTPAEVAAKLAHHGIADAEHEVITSAMAAATLVEEGEDVMVVGSAGLGAAIADRGATVVQPAPRTRVDAVVVGITESFDYAMLSHAMQAVRAGARFIATNTDPTYPGADELLPGNGAIVAAVATATETEPIVAGKPHAAIAALTRQILGDDGVMVGDRPDTDGLFAEAVGYEFALVYSGVTSPDEPVTPVPTRVAPDLLALVNKLT